MNNVIKKQFFKKFAVFSVVGAMVVSQVTMASLSTTDKAHAQEVVYCDDGDGAEDEPSFMGEGAHTDATYTIDCDEKVLLASAGMRDVPSYGCHDSSMQNVCGPVAGLNIVTFYDRYFSNLLPDFEPGMVTGSGAYRYYPDINPTAASTALSSLYSLMDIANVGGTTEANFQNGLRAYVQGQGYSISYSSVHQNSATVNISALATAMNQNKVAVVMCSQYNFIHSMRTLENGNAYLTKIYSAVGHMMMVYGYQTFGFYKNGNLVTTKTFLNVCNGYATHDIGWMELNDSAVINNALVVSIT